MDTEKEKLKEHSELIKGFTIDTKICTSLLYRSVNHNRGACYE